MAFKPFPKKTDKKKEAEVKGKGKKVEAKGKGKAVPPAKKPLDKKKKK